jgi:hypothetical protein
MLSESDMKKINKKRKEKAEWVNTQGSGGP